MDVGRDNRLHSEMPKNSAKLRRFGNERERFEIKKRKLRGKGEAW